MKYEKFEMSLIIPFYYEKSFYEKIGDTDGMPAMYLESYLPKINILNEYAESLCTVYKKHLFKCMKFSIKARETLGIHKNENNIYYLKKNPNISFSIGKILVWFHPDGNAFLSLQICSKSLMDVEILELKKSLVNIREKHRYIEYIKPEFVEKLNRKPQEIIIKSVIKKFFQMIGMIYPIEHKTTYQEAYILSMGFVPSSDEKFFNHLEKLRKNKLAEGPLDLEIEKNFYFVPQDYPYLHWIMAEKMLALTIDNELAEKCSNSNRAFLHGNFVTSVFNNYLMLYLYYIKLRNNYNALSIQYAKANQQLSLYPSKKQVYAILNSVKPLAKYAHVNCLFMEYLCGNTWNLTTHLEELKKSYDTNRMVSEQYNVFISYRRLYGGYVAQHIFTELRHKGYNPFFDMDSLKAGSFDKQLEEKIRGSDFMIAVLTPGSLDNCISNNKEDWVYREIKNALEYKKTIITVLVDGFEFPKELPEEIKEIKNQHGIHMTIEHLNSSLEAIISLLEKK